jgi:hypothetical protein
VTLVERDVDVWSLPLGAAAQVLHPDRALVSFGDGYSLDLGALCYARRSTPIGPTKNNACPKSLRRVALPSHEPQRAAVVRQILAYLSDQMSVAGKRPATVFASARHYLRFVEWAEQHGFDEVLTDQTVLRPAIASYVEHLRHTVATGQLALNTAAIAQQCVLVMAGDLAGVDDLHHGLNLLRIDKYSRRGTEPPAEEAQARLLALCHSVFDGLAELCLDFRAYPFALAIPPTLGAPDNCLWVFPLLKWCMAPHELARRDSLKSGFWAYDYAAGRLATVDEIAHRYVHKPDKNRLEAPAEATIASATRHLEAANGDPQHGQRRNAALLAHNAFIVLFLAHTGMNWATVRELPWADEHEINAGRLGFRAVKYRAGGRLVSFEIQSTFLRTFKKFLQLRSYLLNGVAFDRLFLAAGNTGRRLEPLKAKALTSIFDALRRLDPNLPDIKAKQWRAAKSDWLLRRTDPSTTALILQNSEATVLGAYAAGSATTQGEELRAFFDRLHASVLERGVALPGSIPNAVGACSAYGQPHQTTAAPIASDCKTPQGCLFCDKYRLHADERDTRKLLSCRYCVYQTAHLATSEEHFQQLFGPLVSRIGALLDMIDQREPGLVGKVEREVEEGELDPYWARKLEMLLELELVE